MAVATRAGHALLLGLDLLVVQPLRLAVLHPVAHLGLAKAVPKRLRLPAGLGGIPGPCLGSEHEIGVLRRLKVST